MAFDPKIDKKQLNIHSASAGLELKQDLRKIAAKLAKTPNALLNEIFKDALANKSIYSARLKGEARDKNGSHICCTVSSKIKESLSAWAIEEGSNMALWSNYILEKAIELKYSQYLK